VGCPPTVSSLPVVIVYQQVDDSHTPLQGGNTLKNKLTSSLRLITGANLVSSNSRHWAGPDVGTDDYD
jgi:hypothetical protein